MARKKILSWALVAMMSLSSVWEANPYAGQLRMTKAQSTEASEESDIEIEDVQSNATDYGLCDNTKDGAILHAFCWSFNTIKNNLADIAEAGYTTVQTSPINECLAGENGGMDLFGNGKWYYHYQPTDWKIGNYQLGSRDDYKAMCAEADKYGIKIISDVLPNHTTPTLSAVSDDLANAAGGKGKGQLYHNKGFDEIGNYGDRTECTLGQMGGLPDVNTENQGFQEYYLKFCNDVIACGGDGFRYDTAKHIGVPSDPKDSSNTRGENDFWDIATGKKAVNGVKLEKPSNFFIYGEVLQDNGIPYKEYASYMNMTASSYGHVLRNNLRNFSLNAGTLSDWCHETPDKIVTWVESHDTYCNDHESGWMTDWQIRAGWAVIAARSNGTPLFFSRPDGSDGSSGNYWGKNKIGAIGNDQFKNPEVAACNRFRNAMVGESEYMSNPGGNNNLLVIERGNKGAVIINAGSQASNIKLEKVADGSYVDDVTGETVKVSGGVLDYNVKGGSIAVIYEAGAGVAKGAKITASKATGSNFTDAFDLTLTVKNAEKASYKTSEGESGDFTSSKSVKVGSSAQIGDTVIVTVEATGENGEKVTETFKYTMVEATAYPSDAKFMILAKKKDFDKAPYAYIYEDKTALNGEWPGKAMEDYNDDYYIFYSSSFSKGTVILVSNDKSWRSTPDQQPGIAVSGLAEFDKSSCKFTEVTAATSKPKTTATPKATVTATPKVTTAPKVTATPKASQNETISVSKEDGTEFKTETMDVTITLNGVSQGKYSVDNGPEKEFTNKTTVTVGQGKIADSNVTLSVTANNKTEKFTYKKVFDASSASAKTAAVRRIQSLMAIVEDVAQVNAGSLSNDSLDASYQTNTVGLGKKTSITVDESISDWDDSMLIARGNANDDPRVYRPNSMYEVPIDAYALYGAYDDKNLYLMWEMTNVQDVVAPNDDYPLSQGTMFLNMNIPFFIAIDNGKEDTKSTKCTTSAGGTFWDSGITISQNVNRLIAISTNGANGPFVYNVDSSGFDTVEKYSKQGGGKSGAEKSGIQFGYGTGILSKEIIGINGAYGENNNRVVGDVCDSSADRVDFNANGHSSAKMDYHYEIAIPYEELGVSASDVESNGLGVMVIATSGKSGMDCLPYDVAMNDQADMDDSAGSQENNSFEKSDEDNITASFARIAVGEVQTAKPSSSSSKATATPKVTSTPKATETETEETATATPKVTSTPKATDATTSDSDKFTVNFGADRSSPQYNDTSLKLKAIAQGGAGSYKYEFYVDGKSVQSSSSTDSYTWKNDTAANHTIKVVVEDADGNKISCEKAYVLEKGQVDDDQTPDQNTTAFNFSVATNATASQYAKQALSFTLNASGGSGNYHYSITAKSTAKNAKTISLLNSDESNSCTWTPSVAGKYKMTFTVRDTAQNGDVLVKYATYQIKAIDVMKFAVSKYSVKKGKKVTFTMDAKSVMCKSSKMKYQILVKKKGTSKLTVIRKYATSKKYVWKTKKKGTYTLYMYVKDTKGNVKKVQLKKALKVK